MSRKLISYVELSTSQLSSAVLYLCLLSESFWLQLVMIHGSELWKCLWRKWTRTMISRTVLIQECENMSSTRKRKTQRNWVLSDPPVGSYMHEYFRSEEELPLDINQAAVCSITGFRSEMSDIKGCCPGHLKGIFQPCGLMRGKRLYVYVVNEIRHRYETR